jgi:hypothetical protein
MSSTVADASRWVGVSALLVEFLSTWLDAPKEPPPAPRGIVAAARRFIQYALAGIALDRRERPDPGIPIMASITGLDLARGVSRRLAPGTSAAATLEGLLHAHLDALGEIERGHSQTGELRQRVRSLKAFFQELQAQGNRARHSAFARGEMPQA